MPGADTKIMTFVKEAADRFSMLAASVEELSVPMHFDGEVFVPICSFFFCLLCFCLHVHLQTTKLFSIVFTHRNSNMRCDLPGRWL